MPTKAAKAALSADNCFVTRSRSSFNCFTTPDQFAISFPLKGGSVTHLFRGRSRRLLRSKLMPGADAFAFAPLQTLNLVHRAPEHAFAEAAVFVYAGRASCNRIRLRTSASHFGVCPSFTRPQRRLTPIELSRFPVRGTSVRMAKQNLRASFLAIIVRVPLYTVMRFLPVVVFIPLLDGA